MEPLTVWVIHYVDHFARKHKFTIGDRWIDTCLDVQTSLVEASYIRDKRSLLIYLPLTFSIAVNAASLRPSSRRMIASSADRALLGPDRCLARSRLFVRLRRCEG